MRVGKRYTDMGFVEINETRNISKAKPQMATPKLRQWEEGDHYSLASAHSKPAAPALATDACRCCKRAIGEALPQKRLRYLTSHNVPPTTGDCNLCLMNLHLPVFVLIFCECSQMRP